MAPVASHPPPPKRVVPPKPPVDASLPPPKETWGGWFKRKGTSWGTVAAVKGIAISDNLGGRVNGWAEHVRPLPSGCVVAEGEAVLTRLRVSQVGAERFWPTSNDGVQEMEKAARIIKGALPFGM